MAQADVDRTKIYIAKLRKLLLPGERRDRLIEEFRRKIEEDGLTYDQLNVELENYT
jgi:hypothetical protein